MVKGSETGVWSRLTGSLGLPAQPVPGDRVAGGPELAGTDTADVATREQPAWVSWFHAFA